MSELKRGLVLEGGGMRGMFTAGILDVFIENGVPFEGVIGVSAGATFGCNYVSRQAGRVLRYQMRFVHDSRYMSLRSLLRTGDYVGAEFAYHHLPTQLDLFDFETFRLSPTAFYVVCTDVQTGEPVYRQLHEMNHDELDWMRASASMPIVSRPVSLEGRQLLDGGISDSIPLQQFQRMGYERNVVVLTQPAGFQKHKPSMLPLMRFLLRKHPAIARAMTYRHEMYNAQLSYIEQQEQLGQTYVIRPDEALGISRTEHNKKEIQRVYDLGRAAGENYLTDIQQFLTL